MKFGLLLAVALTTIAAPAHADLRGDCGNLDTPEKSVIACTRLIKSSSTKPADLAVALSNRGRSRIVTFDLDGALADLDKAVALKPDLVDAYSARGEVFADREDFERAFADFEKALSLDPNHPETFVRRGNAFMDKKDYVNTFIDLNHAIELKPDLARAYNSRGVAYIRLGATDRAIAEYDKAIELKPDFATAFSNRGEAKSVKRDYESALADYSTAIKLRPKLYFAFFGRGRLYYAIRTYDRAIADITAAIKLKPDYVDAYNDRGIAYAALGETDKAIKDYTKAIEIKPTFAFAYNNRALVYAGLGDLAKALSDYDRATTIDPTYAWAFNNRGTVFYDADDFDRAIADFTQAIYLNPTFASAYRNRAIAYRDSGRYESAIRDFNHLLVIEPDSAYGHEERGWAYKALGDDTDADLDFEKARQIRIASGVFAQAAANSPMKFAIVRLSARYCEPRCPEWISADGDIVGSSPADLKRILKSVGNRPLPIVINSPGGEVDAATAMGRIVRSRHLDTAVGKTAFDRCNPWDKGCTPRKADQGRYRGSIHSDNSYCMSACPLFLAGGVDRYVGPWAVVGVHRVKTTYTKVIVTYETTYEIINGRKHILSRKVVGRKNAGTVETTKMSNSEVQQLEGYLREMGIGTAIVGMMKETPYDDIRRLSLAELSETHIDPRLVQPETLSDPSLCVATPPIGNCVTRPAASP